MSTYAVFGMTRSRAVEDARRNTEAINHATKQQLTEAEWIAVCDKKADATMAGTHCVRLGDMFDAPQFAQQFLELCKRQEHRNLHIKAHTLTGETDPKTRRPIKKWVEVGTDAERQIQERLKSGAML